MGELGSGATAAGVRSRAAVLLAIVAALLVGTAAAGAVRAPVAPGGGPERGVVTVPSAPSATPSIIVPILRPTWINVTNTTPHAAPPAATGAASAYDPLTNQTVYFGGCVENGACPDNQTWVFASGVWTNVTDHADSPPARENAAMDYDPNMRAVLLFGGYGVDGPLNDTWTYQDGVWTNVSFYSIAPPAREGASLAFDPQPEENGSVLFGGCVPVFIVAACDSDTWVWQGDAGWVELNTSVAPGVRGWAMMAYDATSGYIVLFGGTNGVLGVYDDTWELYGGQWWNVTPAKSSPAAVADGGMLYVPRLAGLLLFGGFNSAGDYVATTWGFSNGAWFEDGPATSPPARGSFDLALDGTGTTPILEGGENATQDFRDTWAYELGPGSIVTVNVSAAEVGEPVGVQVEVGFGTAPYTVSVTYGDGTSAHVSGPGPYFNTTHVFGSTGTFVLGANVTDAVGASVTALVASLPVSVGPRVVAQAAPASTDVGLPVRFTSTVLVNGTLPISYAWSFGDGTTASTADPTHTYRAAGTYRVTLNATDQDRDVSSSSLAVVVAPTPTLVGSTVPAAPDRGIETTFLVSVSGGTGPYSYDWRFGDGTGSLLPTPQHWYNSSGTYLVSVWVNDSVGDHAHVAWNVTVPSAAPLWGSLSGAPAWFWAGLGVIAAAGVGGAVLFRRPRPSRPNPPA